MNLFRRNINNVAVKCPTCKALFETNSEHIVCQCEECGSKFIIDEAIVYEKPKNPVNTLISIIETKGSQKLEKEKQKLEEIKYKEKLKQEELKRKEIENKKRKEKAKKVWTIIGKCFLWYLGISFVIALICEIFGIDLPETEIALQYLRVLLFI